MAPTMYRSSQVHNFGLVPKLTSGKLSQNPNLRITRLGQQLWLKRVEMHVIIAATISRLID